MTNPLGFHTMDELSKLLGSDMMEIVFLIRKKQFESFQRVLLSLPPQNQDHQFTQRVLDLIDQRINAFPLSQEALQRANSQPTHSLWKANVEHQRLFSKVAQLQNMNLLLNGLNLCASYHGFPKVLEKLKAMGGDIQALFEQVQSALVDNHDLYIEYEYDQVLSLHLDMLDSQRRNPYSEEQMKELVDQEYNLLQLFLQALQRDPTGSQEQLIFSALSLLSMFTISLKGFEELYFFHNRQEMGSVSFHPFHERWMGMYSAFSSPWFVQRLQDYGFLEADLSTSLVDMYYVSILSLVKEAREKIEDNLFLMTAFDNSSLFQSYKSFSSQEVVQSIREIYQMAGRGLNQVILLQTFQEAMDQAALQ